MPRIHIQRGWFLPDSAATPTSGGADMYKDNPKKYGY